MDRSTITREAVRFGLLLAALLLVYNALGHTGLYRLTSGETEGLNTLIVVVGSIYAVILAFAIFVIWGQFTEVENCVMRECSALDDLLRFSAFLPPDFSRDVRREVAAYAQHVFKHEWQALGEGRRDKRAEDLFSGLITTIITEAHTAEGAVYDRMVEMARRAGERRAERVTRSLTRIPPTMFWFVNSIAASLILLVSIYPFHHHGVGMALVGLVAALLFLANFVMRDMDNPLQGAWNVSPRPFSELR